MHYSVGCTATKIGDRKFLTAAHCVDDLAVGTTIRLTNHPQRSSVARQRRTSSRSECARCTFGTTSARTPTATPKTTSPSSRSKASPEP
ncbi:MAG: trypsin-like serine protease [Sandaracinus sp.]|nr:trypsin-like serine protease [Sandaracinus sp.]